MCYLDTVRENRAKAEERKRWLEIDNNVHTNILTHSPIGNETEYYYMYKFISICTALNKIETNREHKKKIITHRRNMGAQKEYK